MWQCRRLVERRADFHPRYAALARRYRYRIFCQPVRDPLRERYAWRVWPAAGPGSLQAAAKQLLGTHDFAAFGSPPRTGGGTVRRCMRADWRAQADELIFEITANAFLFRMVRRLVGFQVSIGQGMLDVSAVSQCLQSGSRELVKVLGPCRKG